MKIANQHILLLIKIYISDWADSLVNIYLMIVPHKIEHDNKIIKYYF